MSKSLSTVKAIAICSVMLPCVAACTPVGVVAGIGATVGAATLDERGLAGSADDARIRAEVNAAWAGQDFDALTDIGLMVHEGNVVLTGAVKAMQTKTTAIALVKQVEGVNVVYDHIHINPNTGVADYADDGRIIANMRRSIFFDGDIISLNYNLDASDHVLYIQGIAQSLDEKFRVLDHARDVSGVRSIVEYIRIKSPEPTKTRDDQENPKT